MSFNSLTMATEGLINLGGGAGTTIEVGSIKLSTTSFTKLLPSAINTRLLNITQNIKTAEVDNDTQLLDTNKDIDLET